MTHAYTATLPDRVSTLERSVNSILPQVDKMQVVLNNYKTVPKFLINPKITVVHHDNSMEDGSRFINIQSNGYTLVFDDDIEYHSNYVSYLKQCLTHLQDFHRKPVIVGPMGKVLNPRPVKSYYKDIERRYKTFEDIDHHYVVDVIGACGVMWDSNTKVTQDIILTPNSDLCLAKFAKDNDILQIVVAHKATWLKNLMPNLPKDTLSIFGKYRNNDAELTKFVNTYL